MRKILKFLTSKMFSIGLIVLIQLVFLGFILHNLVNDDLIGIYLNVFLNIVAFFIVLKITTSDINPEYKIAWLIPILVTPIFGTFFYILYYRNNIKPKYKNKFHSIISDRKDLLMEVPNKLQFKEINYLNNNGWRYYRNTTSLFLASGEEKLEQLLKDLKEAKEFILMEYFIISKGYMFEQIMNVLIEKAKEGVKVKLIYDDLGSADRLPLNFRKKLKKYGIIAYAFNPMSFHINFGNNYRSHRKIVVIDNKVGFTGGVNIGDEYINKVTRFGHWQDSAIRIEGRAVWSLTLTFLENWNFITKENINYLDYKIDYSVESEEVIAPFADNPIENKQITKSMLLYLIGEAKHEILITSPYLILDSEFLLSLKMAAKSGVKVKIVIPKVPDKKIVYLVTESYALELAKYGIEIYKYDGFIHAKLYVFDNNKAIVGTSNLDFRSLYLHFENNIYLYNSKTVTNVTNYINNSILNSSFESVESLTKDSYTVRFLQAVFRGFSPIL